METPRLRQEAPGEGGRKGGGATLDECDGNRTHAAKKLGISLRALIYKLPAIEDEA